jgi:hypothetical protein
MSPHLACAAASLLLLLGACSDPLEPAQLVRELRVLGARVEVEGDPERAAPLPGERATVRFLLAAPEPAPIQSFSLRVCPAAAGYIGPPRCAGPELARAQSTEPSSAAPQLGFVLPSDFDLEAYPRLAVLGVVCAAGMPLDHGEYGSCDGTTEPLRVALELSLPRDNDVNHNPAFVAEPLSLDGAVWNGPSAVTWSCEDGTLPMLRAGSGTHTIEVTVDAASRERLPRSLTVDPGQESLRLAHFSTAGDLERAFSSVPERAQALSLTWHAPTSSDPAASLTRFWFVVRDGRGGSAFAERALCVMP